MTLPFLTHILLTVAWMALTGLFSAPNALLGFVLTYLLMGIVAGHPDWRRYVTRIPALAVMLLYFLKELVVANFVMARAVLLPAERLRPAIIAVPLDIQSDMGITLLANLITLTPGTLSLEISSDKKVLYVHTMHLDDPESFRRSVKQGFEKYIREVTDA